MFKLLCVVILNHNHRGKEVTCRSAISGKRSEKQTLTHTGSFSFKNLFAPKILIKVKNVFESHVAKVDSELTGSQGWPCISELPASTSWGLGPQVCDHLTWFMLCWGWTQGWGHSSTYSTNSTFLVPFSGFFQFPVYSRLVMNSQQSSLPLPPGCLDYSWEEGAKPTPSQSKMATAESRQGSIQHLHFLILSTAAMPEQRLKEMVKEI